MLKHGAATISRGLKVSGKKTKKSVLSCCSVEEVSSEKENLHRLWVRWRRWDEGGSLYFEQLQQGSQRVWAVQVIISVWTACLQRANVTSRPPSMHGGGGRRWRHSNFNGIWSPAEILSKLPPGFQLHVQREVELHTQSTGIGERCTQRDKRPSRIEVVWGDNAAQAGQDEGRGREKKMEGLWNFSALVRATFTLCFTASDEGTGRKVTEGCVWEK